MFAKITIAKYAVHYTVGVIVKNAAATLIIKHTEKNEDDFIVNLSSAVIGFWVAGALHVHTDALVDKTVARYETFKNRKEIPK